MRSVFIPSLLAALCASTLLGCTTAPVDPVSQLNIQCQAPQQPRQQLSGITGLRLLGTSVANSKFATSAAEIVSYDTCSDKLYVVNAQAKRVDVLNLDATGRPDKEGDIDLQSAARHSGTRIGAANSVATHHGSIIRPKGLFTRIEYVQLLHWSWIKILMLSLTLSTVLQPLSIIPVPCNLTKKHV